MKHWNASGLAGLAVLLLPAPLAAQGEGDAGAALFDVNLGLSLWTVVVFLLLLFVLGKFAWGPILSAAEAREKRIQDALDEAERRHQEATRLLEEHRAQLAEARRHAQDIVSEGKTAGERVRRDIEEKARAEGQQMVERARREIEREKEAALDELRRESVELAMAAAGRLLREKVDSDQDRQLVVGYLDDLTRAGDGGSARA